MKTFHKQMITKKTISVWGIGYLGYTIICKLQNEGFHIYTYDFNQNRMDKLHNYCYPDNQQKDAWSKHGKLPEINYEQLTICKSYKELFQSDIHLISFPENQAQNYIDLTSQFIDNKHLITENTLAIFQSAGVPGDIVKHFQKPLKKNNIKIGITTMFRNDWTIEEFLNPQNKKVIAANSILALDNAKCFMNLSNLNFMVLDTIKEAEVYQNAKIGLQSTIIGFFNQLSLSYPHVNVNKLSHIMLNDNTNQSINLGAQSIEYKVEQSYENLLEGAYENHLSILNESNNANIAFLFYYVNLIKTNNISEVTLFGLSSQNSKKDFRFSPSVIVAQYLLKEGISVYIHDNNLSKEELEKILPTCHLVTLPYEKISTKALIIMNLSTKDKTLTQKQIEDSEIYNLDYIIDNTGFFRHFDFSPSTLYHHLCDDNLIKVI